MMDPKESHNAVTSLVAMYGGMLVQMQMTITLQAKQLEEQQKINGALRAALEIERNAKTATVLEPAVIPMPKAAPIGGFADD